jgi:hypothetical protein
MRMNKEFGPKFNLVSGRLYGSYRALSPEYSMSANLMSAAAECRRGTLTLVNTDATIAASWSVHPVYPWLVSDGQHHEG